MGRRVFTWRNQRELDDHDNASNETALYIQSHPLLSLYLLSSSPLTLSPPLTSPHSLVQQIRYPYVSSSPSTKHRGSAAHRPARGGRRGKAWQMGCSGRCRGTRRPAAASRGFGATAARGDGARQMMQGCAAARMRRHVAGSAGACGFGAVAAHSSARWPSCVGVER
ncbi:hypothetical protein PVAP13_2NG282603 [Panicum virgatum]|uniref:Uncharacterized protein n=1 Tax=Panicum virgatum TaxID=38727 RepID=A0A8T0VEY0_PANVG|nr:hypothetical protein PVAP13_2NG282603 [Panicum virgatum]